MTILPNLPRFRCERRNGVGEFVGGADDGDHLGLVDERVHVFEGTSMPDGDTVNLACATTHPVCVG